MDIVKRVETLEAVNRKIFAILARIESRLDVMATKEDLAGFALKSHMDERFDGLARQIEDIRFRLAVHSDTLLSHHQRLSKLESSGL